MTYTLRVEFREAGQGRVRGKKKEPGRQGQIITNSSGQAQQSGADYSQDGEREGGRETLSRGHLIRAEDDEGAGGGGAEHHHDLRRLDQGDPPLVVALLAANLRTRGGEGGGQKGESR